MIGVLQQIQKAGVATQGYYILGGSLGYQALIFGTKP
jgi:hypothetical protein